MWRGATVEGIIRGISLYKFSMGFCFHILQDASTFTAKNQKELKAFLDTGRVTPLKKHRGLDMSCISIFTELVKTRLCPSSNIEKLSFVKYHLVSSRGDSNHEHS